MKLYLYTLIFALIAFASSYANDVRSTRSEISSKLNAIVKDLKEDFRDADTLINKNSKDVKVLEEQVNDLVVRSGAGETNPTILKHGKASVSRLSSCDYNSENLHWNGSDWVCQEIDVLSDCSPASDEYRVSTGSGSYSCQKNQSGSVINYYWKFTGNSITCSPTTGLYGKVYGCFYKNKLNKEVQVASSNCKGTKPATSTKTCKASWAVSAWSNCSKSCGSGTQTRTVTCPAGKVCLDTKPETVQACNTHVCTASWKATSWSSCSKTCGGGRQTRKVTCPSGFVCPGSKPSTNQSCNTQACTASWKVTSWSSCSKTCGGGIQTRKATCPSGFVCNSPKPVESMSCNMQLCKANWVVGAWGSCAKDPITGNGLRKRSVTCPSGYICDAKTKPLEFKDCTASWKVTSWSSCSKTCGGGTQSRTVTCPSGSICKGVKPATRQSCNTQACTASWKVTSWSSCSKTCGGGTQTRKVTCPTGFVCPGGKPAASQSCNTQRCPIKPNLTCRGVKVGGFSIGTMSTRCRKNQAYSDPNPIIHGKCCSGQVGACAGGGGCGVPTVYIKPKMSCPSGYKLSGTMCY